MNRIIAFSAAVAVVSSALFALDRVDISTGENVSLSESCPTNKLVVVGLSVATNRVWHTHCILIGEGLETTAPYQFVTPWGRCTITHEEWEVLNRVIRRVGANAGSEVSE